MSYQPKKYGDTHGFSWLILQSLEKKFLDLSYPSATFHKIIKRTGNYKSLGTSEAVFLGFPGGPVVKSPPGNAVGTGRISGPGSSHASRDDLA